MSRPLPRTLVYWLLLVLNSMAVAGLLASYLAGIVSPVVLWPLAFAGLAYPLLLLTTVAFAVLWAVRGKWKLLLFHVLLIAFRVDLVQAHFQLRTEGTQAKGNGIRVMSYNVHLFSAYTEADNADVQSSILKNIETEHPHIICLQEYFSFGGKKHERSKAQLASFRKGKYAHFEGYNDRLGKTYSSGSALATFTDYPIVQKGRLVAGDNEAMRCIYSDLRIGTDTVRVYNVHLESIRIQEEDFDAMNRVLLLAESDSLEQLNGIVVKLRNAFVSRAELSDSLSAHIGRCPYPVIVCGDFNDTPASYSYQRIAKGLEDSFRDAGRGIGVTYARIPLFRIDNVLYSSQFKASSHEVHHWPHSDHFAMTAILEPR